MEVLRNVEAWKPFLILLEIIVQPAVTQQIGVTTRLVNVSKLETFERHPVPSHFLILA
jgi:hypothetical protein